MMGVDSDEGDEEGAEEDNDIAIRASAPSQAWNKVDEMDPSLNDSWMTWSENNSYNGEFAVGQEFNSLH